MRGIAGFKPRSFSRSGSADLTLSVGNWRTADQECCAFAGIERVRVFSLSLDTTDVDAFSLWRQRTPFIFLNTRKSAEHARFDAAHELGHLVLHRHGSPQGREAEKEADTFASAFLMPRATLLTQVPRLTG